MSQDLTKSPEGKLFRCDFASAPANSHGLPAYESGLLQSSVVNLGATISPLITAPVTELSHMTGLFGAANAVGSIGREAIPWESIADWTHNLPKTSTDHWLDVIDGAVRGPHHRWLRHNPIDFFEAWLKDGSGGLKVADYVRHLTLDAITTSGIPMLPEAVHELLVKAGIPFSKLVAFTHLNVFDLAVGSIAVVDGGYTLFLAATGHLPWGGTETFILTFGIGGVELVSGLASENPFLIAAGAMHMTSGAISLWEHWTLPEPSLFDLALPYLLKGAGIGALASAVRLAICWRNSTPEQRLNAGGETFLLSLSSSLLGGVSSWLAIPAALGYGLSKFAWRVAEQDSTIIDRSTVSSEVSFSLAIESLLKNGGPAAVDSFRDYLTRSVKLETSLAPEFFKNCEIWDRPPVGAEHVVASTPFPQAEWPGNAEKTSGTSFPDKEFDGPEFKMKEWVNE